MKNHHQQYSLFHLGHIEDFGLSARVTNALVDNGITTLSELLALTEYELMDIGGLGVIGCKEIQDKISSLSPDEIDKLVDHFSSGENFNEKSINKLIDKQKIEVKDFLLEVPIKKAYFSNRIINSLSKHGITVLGDLSKYTYEDLYKWFQGLGGVSIEEIKLYLNNTVNNPITLHEFLVKGIQEKHRNMLDRYYSLTSDFDEKVTLESIAIEFGVTRERVRQIIRKVLEKIERAAVSKRINSEIESQIFKYMNSPIHEIQGVSDVYNNFGIIRIYIDAKIVDASIYKSEWLASKWLVDKSFNIEQQVEKATKALKAQTSPVKISDLSEEYLVDERIFYDFRKTTIVDGVIVLNTNKQATGNDLIWGISTFMDEAIRPVSVSEVADSLGADLERVRSFMCRVPGAVNVGLSKYALKKYGYTDKTTIEVIKELLKEEGQPIHISRIISYVRKYKLINDSSIVAAIGTATHLFVHIGGSYYALREWGYTPAKKQSERLEISARDAVFSVLSLSKQPMSIKDILNAVMEKYGRRSTASPGTIYSVLTGFCEDSLVVRLGNKNLAYYVLKQNANNLE